MNAYNTNDSLYRRDGVLFPLTALSASEVHCAFQEYLQLCRPGHVVVEGDNRIFGHLLHPWIADLVSHPCVLRVVRALIGQNVLAWVSEFNSKAPHTPHFFSWHQDLYYWRHQYENPCSIPMVTVWLALTSVTESNGGMRVIPGSHSHLVPHDNKPESANLLTQAQHIRCEVDERNAVSVDLAAGEFSIHHPLLWHASGPNTNSHPRVGLVTRYMAPEVVPPLRPAYAWLVSGEDKLVNWDHVAPLDHYAGLELRERSIRSVQRVTGAKFK